MCTFNNENKVFNKISLKNFLIINAFGISSQSKHELFFTAISGKNKGISVKATLCTHLPLDIFPDYFTTFHFSMSSAAGLYATGTPQPWCFAR